MSLLQTYKSRYSSQCYKICLAFNFMLGRKHWDIAKLINYRLIVDASYLPRAITRRQAVVINFMRLWRFFYHFITRLGVSRRVSSADIRGVATRSLTHRCAASSCIAVRCTSHSARLRSANNCSNHLAPVCINDISCQFTLLSFHERLETRRWYKTLSWQGIIKTILIRYRHSAACTLISTYWSCPG